MDEEKVKLTFSTLDYILFGTMMFLSFLIGLYYGFIRKEKQDTTAEYLLGSKKMKVWPTAISITATVPAEMYKHGTQYWACAISGIIVTLSVCYIYLPVFHDLGSVSCYAYLEKRYNQQIRQIASFLFFIYVVLMTPLLAYTPSLAFSQVSGISLHYITPILVFVCVFYTTFGGLRAVVWTDTLQFSAMILAVIIVMILGTNEVGGMTNVFNIASEGNRIVWFNLDPNPFIRSSFWMVSIGLTSMWISNVGITPECVQRFVAIPKLNNAIKACWIFGIGHIVIKLCAVYNGMLIFAKYNQAKCDPVFNGDVGKYDQIFPYYVMDVARNIPGLPGLFIVGALSAALSSMSSCLNSLSGTIYEDFLKPFMPNATEKQASTIMKLVTFTIGCVCFILVFVIEKLGGVFSIGIALSGLSSGTLLGLFTMGMISEKFNTKGALWGSIVSITIVTIITVGAQINIYSGNLRYETLPFNIEQCDASLHFHEMSHLNSSVYVENFNADNSSIPWIFRINYMYYSLIGTILVIIVGYPISLMTGGTKNLDQKLLSPLFRRSHVNELEIEFPLNLEEQKNLTEKCQE
ncbi:CLUMA_CG005138, isoform A [Clunio marinus]|uniref:CLUMA_CG005138, isoform A n=1 Tax=Clunio marinus TaxID=568069 RepID=A0A1J1HTS9_9DIPT|nr:CLUMA_CG005138, isoform A [Clunio marinus]